MSKHFEDLCKKANKTAEEQAIIDRVLANRRGEKTVVKRITTPEPTPGPTSEEVVEPKSTPKKKKGKRNR